MAQGLIVRAVNNTSATIVSGKAVYVTGIDNETKLTTIALASYQNKNTMPSIGIATTKINVGEIGSIRISGIIIGINTSSIFVNTGVFIGSLGNLIFVDPILDLKSTFISQQIGITVTREENGQILLFPMEVRKKINNHPDLINVTENQHHNRLHAIMHNIGAEDDISNSYIPRNGSKGFTAPFTAEQKLIVSEGIDLSKSSFPTNPSGGTLIYRSDLSSLFTYDSSRLKWLGELESEGAGRSGTIVGGSTENYLRRFDRVTMSSSSGTFIPYDITITGISLLWTNPDAGPLSVSSLKIVRNGSILATIPITNSSINLSDLTINTDLSVNGILAFYIDLGGDPLTHDISNPQLRCWFRRETT